MAPPKAQFPLQPSLNPGSISMKLSHQFHGGGGGEKRIADEVGARSNDWNEMAKALIPKGMCKSQY